MSTWTLHPGEHETFSPGTGYFRPRAHNGQSNARSFSLNGTWRFRLSNTSAAAEEFAEEGYVIEESKEPTLGWKPGGVIPEDVGKTTLVSEQNSGWGSIDVPSHWVLQGYGLPAYQNINFPFPCDPPIVPTENPTGDYLRRFDLPDDFAAVSTSGTVRLRFDGVESWFKVWLNGHLLGSATGSRLATEFDITSILKPSSNVLAVRVHQWSAATYLEDQDQWWMPGIFRNVTLCHRPVKCVEDYWVKASYNNTTGSGMLKVECQPEGRIVVPELGIDVPTGQEVSLSVQAWSAETPKLYQGTLETEGEIIPLGIGFRTVEISDDLIKINGRRIHFKGVNRHEFHPYTGRTMDMKTMVQDIKLMKQYGFNAVRTSHYPPDYRFLDLCDEHGLWVIDEVDLETHGFCREGNWKSNPSDDPRWADAFVDRAERTVGRDKNHCSIIMWSMGNEAAYGCNTSTMIKRVRGVDPSRPIHYEGDRDCYDVDVYSLMYKSVQEMDLLGQGKEPAVANDPRQDAKRCKMPFILQEYAHAMGNGPGSFLELQGGFVWEWLDHGLPATTKDGVKYWAYGGDFGEHVHDGHFVCDGMVFHDRQPSPAMAEYKRVFQPVRFTLEGSKLVAYNSQDFADTSMFVFDWVLETKGRKVAAGKLDVPAVAAGSTATIEMPKLPELVGTEHWLTISARLKESSSWADPGHLVAWDQLEIPGSEQGKVTNNDISTVPAIEDSRILFGPAVFDKFSGALLRLNGMDISEFRLDVWRAMIDNDEKGLVGPNKRSPPDKPVTGFEDMHYRLDSVNMDTRTLRIITRVAPAIRQIALKVTYTWALVDDGLKVDIHVMPEGDWGDLCLPRLGIRFGIDQRYCNARWFGLGPGESYPDSKSGSRVGSWSMSVNDMQTDYIYPQENGSRMETRWAELNATAGPISSAISTVARSVGVGETSAAGLRIEGLPHFCYTARRWTSEDLHNATHTCDIVPTDKIWVNIDHALHGLGSAACGPVTMPQYELRPVETSFGFVLRTLYRSQRGFSSTPDG